MGHLPFDGRGKRPVIFVGDDHDTYPIKRRRRSVEFGEQPFLCRPRPPPSITQRYGPFPEYIILREEPPSDYAERLGAEAPVLEHTESGHFISADTADTCASTELLEDHEAAQRVAEHMANFRRRFPDSQHERILRGIINPNRRRRSSESAAHAIDASALASLFSAANEVFFNGRLSQRVAWDWSAAAHARHYDDDVVGTTALRRAATGRRGLETLIVLSAPILRGGRYSRRLLISTFLHELIHSYLFICCGFRARHCGGHTPGFRAIARLIDNWAGPDSLLYLGSMEADLEQFRLKGAEEGEAAWGDMYPCSGRRRERRQVGDWTKDECEDESYDSSDDHWARRADIAYHPVDSGWPVGKRGIRTPDDSLNDSDSCNEPFWTGSAGASSRQPSNNPNYQHGPYYV